MHTTTMASTNTSEHWKHHVIFNPLASWGHLRPAVPIMFKIVQARPDIVISVAVVGLFKDKMEKEVARYCSGSNSVFRDNIRIIQLSKFVGPEFECWVNLSSLWPDFLDKSLRCEPIACFSGRIYPSAPKPSLCIVDIFFVCMLAPDFFNGREIKVMVWQSAGLSAMLDFLGPPEYGGNNDLEARAKELADAKNISLQEAAIELHYNPPEKVKKIPGLPPFYFYEVYGESLPLEFVNRIISDKKTLSRFLRDRCDGAILGNSSITEEETIEALKHWMKDMGGKSCYALGPCVIPDEAAFDPEELANGQEVLQFLDKIYESHGKRSLLYMSFGTVNFPQGETPWQIVDIILDMRIPLVFAIPYSDVYDNRVPNDVRNRLESSDLALIAKWTPQQSLLRHNVTGAFLTHCGQGSVSESLIEGVVMIGWPLFADQPYNCIHMALSLKVAYQLCEVRNDLRPLYRGYEPTGTKEAIDREFRQVLRDAFGADGDAKREILREISGRLKKAWKEDGEASVELRKFLRENFE